jgi:sortase B
MGKKRKNIRNAEKFNEDVNKEAADVIIRQQKATSEMPEESKEVSVDAFLSSLDSYTDENSGVDEDVITKPENTEGTDVDAQGNTTKRKKGKTKKKSPKGSILWLVMFCVCIAVFVVSLVMIGINVYDSYLSKKINEGMSDDFFAVLDRTDLMPYLAPAVLYGPTANHGSIRNTSVEQSGGNSVSGGEYEIIETNSPVIAQLKDKLIEYKENNSDIYGWIQVDGTNISYAIVKGKDNEYYLDHAVNKTYNINGAIFADYRCQDSILDNNNLVLYGHNSSYGKIMFHHVTKFLDRSFFERNKYVTVYTIDGVYRYEIFAIYQTDAEYHYTQLEFETDEDFIKWCNEMKKNSIYKRQTGEFTADTKVITLSTCTNGAQTQRYTLQARLVRIEK